MKRRAFSADFETTVYEGQTHTEVWAAAIVELYTEDVKIFHSIDDLFNYMLSLNCSMTCYFHNLKFDGNFWMSYLLIDKGFTQALDEIGENWWDKRFVKDKDMKNNTFKYVISSMGQWYTITIKVHGHIIELRDSLKLLPFSVKRIGDTFGTKHKKLDMEYTGYRYAGCEITDEERKYIANDVLVVKEALEIMFDEGHTGLTIGSCCLKEFKKEFDKEQYDKMFPNLYEHLIDEELYGSKTIGDYIKKAYRGGWCYLVPDKSTQIKRNGSTFDVNSLYPSMMSSESGNKYPTGVPYMTVGTTIPRDSFYFIRFRTRFKIKKNKLPFVQIKGSVFYKGTESLTTSDIWDRDLKCYCPQWRDINGDIHPATVELTMARPDYELFREHYDVSDFQILDMCIFDTATDGLFDDYMEKYKRIKQTSKGAKRELAKLFLNNLYGKMAASTSSSFKVAYVKEDATIGYKDIPANDKKPGYIPIGAAITSYARCFTIRAAQQNYYGPNKRGFIYADTDSIHCDLSPEEVKGIETHPTDFCKWKLECEWDEAIFTRQKTYIEHIVKADGEPVDPHYDVKCAGMPQTCKELFVASMTRNIKHKLYTEKEREFLKTKRSLSDFCVGLKIPGKLLPKRIPGGILLVDTDYEMRPK